MRKKFILLSMLVCSAFPAWAQMSIDINLSVYPELVAVPGYPVYYAPQMDTNYFFYDGMYWVYQDDDWYSSSWYNGPWNVVNREIVPVFVLRIPVRYYRRTPVYFSGWHRDYAPHWGEHWGNDWQQRHHGWDRWNHKTPPVRPPLPIYQRNYTGDRYPQFQQQQELQSKNYRYQPHDPLVRQQVQIQHKQATVAPQPARIAPIAPVPAPAPAQSKSQTLPHEKNSDGRNSHGSHDSHDPRNNERENRPTSPQENPRDHLRNGPPPIPPKARIAPIDEQAPQKVNPPIEHRPTRDPREQAPQRTVPTAPPSLPPPVPQQIHQPPHERTAEPHQQVGPRAQQPENPVRNQVVPQENNRAQRPEQAKEHDKPNERARDRGNDRDDERGSDRRK